MEQRMGGVKILNKRKLRGVMKYLVQQKRFTIENNIWERKQNLENINEVVAEFEERTNTEVR